MLFTPLTLPNGSPLPNRLAKAAIEESMSEPGQLPGTAIRRLYQRCAEGGTGLLITGNVMVDSRALTGPGAANIAEVIRRFADTAYAAEQAGFNGVQIRPHGGRPHAGA